MFWRKWWQKRGLEKSRQLSREHVVTENEFLDEVHFEGEQAEQLQGMLRPVVKRGAATTRKKPKKTVPKAKKCRNARKSKSGKVKKSKKARKTRRPSRKRKSPSRKRR